MVVLLNEKCAPAALPEVCAPRQKLLEKIRAAATGRFIYVGAPAGSGKTVTALLWNAAARREAQTRIPLWVALDAYDNIPSVFYKLLASVICSTQPDNGRIMSVLDDPAFSSAPVEHTVRLLAELQRDDTLYTLTLDDLHSITNTEILKSLPLVMKRLPRSFTVLFLSRIDPPDEFRGLFRDEGTALIGADDLRFSEAELHQYCRRLGWELTDEEAGFVLMASGGLAINVNAVAKRKQVERGGTEYIFDQYLRQYLWKGWDGGLRDFMLKTSVVDEMSGRLAAALTGRDDARELLGELCLNNTFVTQAGGDLFRYHHLFLAFLRGTAKELGMDMSGPNKIAAAYYLETKQYLIARRYAVQSGDEGLIMQAISQFQQITHLSLDDYVAFAKVFNKEALSEDICERYPFLYIAQAYTAWLMGDIVPFDHYLDKLWLHLPAIVEKYPQIIELFSLTLYMDYRKPMSQLTALLPAMPAFQDKQELSDTSQFPFAHRGIRDWTELADEGIMEKTDRSFGIMIRENYAVMRPCLLSGLLLEQNKIEPALACALEAKAAVTNMQSHEIIFNAYNHLTAAYLAAGNEAMVKKALEETEQYLNRSGAYSLKHNFSALQAKIRFMDADKKAAEDWLENYYVIEAETIPSYKTFQYFTTARAYIVLSKGGEAMSLIQKLIQFCTDYRQPLDLAEAKTLKACLDWACGRRAEAAACLEEALAEMQGRGFIRPIADEGAAVVPVLKRIAAAVGAEDGDGKKRRGVVAAADHVADSVAVHSAERPDTADHSARPRPNTSDGKAEGEPAPTNPVVVKLDRGYVTEVLLAAHEVSMRHRGITAAFKKSGGPVKLSKQQTKMLTLLAQGYKNADIVRITGLAMPTVKKHLTLAYEKLGVHDAMDAILHARKQGILPGKEPGPGGRGGSDKGRF